MNLYPVEDYVRVTTVLYPFSGLQCVDPFVLAAAADRGSRVHKICEGIVRGIWDFECDPDINEYVESFKKWWNPHIEVVTIEKRMWDNDLMFTGQTDLIINTNDGLAVLDLKTSAMKSKTWHPQGSAYAHLAKLAGYDIKRILFLHLSRTGKNPRIYEFPIDDLFLHVLKVYNHFYRGVHDPKREIPGKIG